MNAKPSKSWGWTFFPSDLVPLSLPIPPTSPYVTQILDSLPGDSKGKVLLFLVISQ